MNYYFCVILLCLFILFINFLYLCKKCKKIYNEKKENFIEKEIVDKEDSEIIEDDEEEPPPYVKVVA